MNPFSVLARTWIEENFEAPTPVQQAAWEAISEGAHALVVAPTGSGKTLAAFLWHLDRLAKAPPPPPDRRLRVLYVSPLKALGSDIERNLRAPLAGLQAVASRLDVPFVPLEVGVRTGDTSPQERRRLARMAPDILITTPESLFLMLTSAARETLRSVETVIVDEIHVLAATKRGAHLALSLERLDALLERPAQRLGLSATVSPLEEAARYLGGNAEVRVVAPPSPKQFELRVEVPLDDLAEVGSPVDEIPRGRSASADPERQTIWPAVEERLLELLGAHRSTLVFVNSRRLAERMCASVNERAGREVARAHHGSVSLNQRKEIEEALKLGRLPAVFATSSLELGIDMGSIDLVVHIEAPPSVAAGLQRIGRAGHQVGAVSRGILFPKWRGDLIETAVVTERMLLGALEPLRYPRNPLDVLAQQIVAMLAVEELTIDELAARVRRAAPFTGLPQSALEGVLDMLSGRYPSDEFAELRPRITWDRATGRLTARSLAQRLAVTSGGTIPDRGLFGVYLVGETRSRVGELDEEMVYESRRGEVFVLGSSSWRIQEITHDRVLVTPAPGEPGRTPFWRGDAQGRPASLGRAHGAFLRELGEAPLATAQQRLEALGLYPREVDNLLRYLAEQREACGVLADDRTLVVERFLDAVGDWRLCIHSPLGGQVHAPWALALGARLRERTGQDVQTMYTDDGIVVRLPEGYENLSLDDLVFDANELEALVTAELGGSSLFASRFRECAGRALLLPRRSPGKRTPLWQQRQKSASLLQVASRHASFPIVLEAMRECLQDVFDVPALRDLMTDLGARKMRMVAVETSQPSPFASALLFGYLGAFIYEGDAPLAERRAQALALDTGLLAELLGSAELRELLDVEVLLQVEAELGWWTPERRLRDADHLADCVRVLGPQTEEDLLQRGATVAWINTLVEQGRLLTLRVGGVRRLVAVEDASRLRDALGTVLPPGLPAVWQEAVRDPLGDLVGRYARTHGPFQVALAARELGLGVVVVGQVLERLEALGRVVRGAFRPQGEGVEWCDGEVLRTLRRRSLARLRREVEAVPAQVLGRFLPEWQGVRLPGEARPGTAVQVQEALFRALEQLQGLPLPARSLEVQILGMRVPGFGPGLLDELCAAGEVGWAGAGSLGKDDGWITLYLSDDAPDLLPPAGPVSLSERAEQVLRVLQGGGAMFFRALAQAAGVPADEQLLQALWELVWAGRITNDTLAPLRAWLGEPVQVPAATTALASSLARRRRPGRGPRLETRMAPPAGGGRWSLVPRRGGAPELAPAKFAQEKTASRLVLAEQLLERYGVVTRSVVAAEGVEGGFAGLYPVFTSLEQAGRCRRGYFVEGLGAAQFALPGAVDLLRRCAREAAEGLPADAQGTAVGVPGLSGDGSFSGKRALVLAACDPANPFGAGVDWPPLGTVSNEATGARSSKRSEGPAESTSSEATRRTTASEATKRTSTPEAMPRKTVLGRRAGARVVLVEGNLVLYVERGGRQIHSFTAEQAVLEVAVQAFCTTLLAHRSGSLAGVGRTERLQVEKVDGESVFASPLLALLRAGGFREVPRGLVWQGRGVGRHA